MNPATAQSPFKCVFDVRWAGASTDAFRDTGTFFRIIFAISHKVTGVVRRLSRALTPPVRTEWKVELAVSSALAHCLVFKLDFVEHPDDVHTS